MKLWYCVVMNRFKKRINLQMPLNTFARLICEKYGFDKFLNAKIITYGYEDFSFALTCGSGKYLVKVFNLTRTDEECELIAQRYYIHI